MQSISYLTQFNQLQLVGLTWLTQLHFCCSVRRHLSSCYTNKCNFHAPQMHVEHSYFMRMRSLFGFPFVFFSFSIFIFIFNFYLFYLFILLLPKAVKKMRIKCKFLCCEYPAEIKGRGVALAFTKAQLSLFVASHAICWLLQGIQPSRACSAYAFLFALLRVCSTLCILCLLGCLCCG